MKIGGAVEAFQYTEGLSSLRYVVLIELELTAEWVRPELDLRLQRE